MTTIKLLLLTAFLGHILCWVCDLLLIYAPGGKFGFACLQDNEKMSKVFEGMPLKNPMFSMLAGVFALAMCFCGYLGLYEWMKQFSMTYAVIIIASAIVYIMQGVAHHVFCGILEWFYIRLGRTEEVRKAVVEFFGKTSITMYVCYAGTAVFAIAFLIAVATGQTSLPRWGCIFNVLPLFIILTPLKVPGAGNIAGAVMFLGLFLLL